MTKEHLSPFVYWAQTETHISLKIELKDVKNPEINLNNEQLLFIGRGHGAKGVHLYKFKLLFFKEVNPDHSNYQIFDSHINFSIKKKNSVWWPRLISEPQKPFWLRIDFDKWKSEDGEGEDEEKRNILEDFPELYDSISKEELGYRKEKNKKIYLILFNLSMWIGYIYILIVIGVRYYRDAGNSIPGTYEVVGPAFKFCQLLQYLEVMHPLFGYTNGSTLIPFIQVTGRAFILFIMIELEPKMWTKPVVFYLFIIWATIEIIRYPYYLTNLFDLKIPILTWLRYTIWMPLYPLGILCEGTIILRNILYFEETRRLSISLPNDWNMTFDMPSFLKTYLFLLAVPGTYLMMSHMSKMRKKKLGIDYWKKDY